MMEKCVLISLADKFCNAIGENVAKKLGMYFLNIDDLIEYSLLDSAKMLKVCGKEHYLKQEKNVLKECFDYINTLYSCSYEIFINNQEFFKNAKLIYICLTLSQLEKLNEDSFAINSIAFPDRDDFLKKVCYNVECNNLTKDNLQNILCKFIMGEK